MKRVLNTVSSLKQIGSAMELFTEFNVDLKKIVFFISDKIQILNWVAFRENELGLMMTGYDTNFIIDDNGNLIVKSFIADNFEINSDGELILTEE